MGGPAYNHSAVLQVAIISANPRSTVLWARHALSRITTVCCTVTKLLPVLHASQGEFYIARMDNLNPRVRRWRTSKASHTVYLWCGGTSETTPFPEGCIHCYVRLFLRLAVCLRGDEQGLVALVADTDSNELADPRRRA